MSAAPGRMMAAWVWISLVAAARLSTAEDPRRDAHGALTDLDALFSASESPMETWSEGVFPVPVWKFLKERSDRARPDDADRPQYRCSGATLSVRFPLVRYADLRLEDGRKLLSLPDGCQGSVQTFGPWLLLKLPYTSCHMALWITNGTWFRQLKLRYFDHQLQENITAVAACENPATSLQLAPPLVTCRTTDVTVKLPLGTRLKTLKALGKDGVVRRALTTTTPGAVYVQISTPAHTDSIFEVVYLDAAGEMATMLAVCSHAAAERSGRDPKPRAFEELDLWELWDFDVIPVEPFIPEPTDAAVTPGDNESTMAPTTEATPTNYVSYSDTEIFQLWVFDEIPDGQFTVDGTTTSPPTETMRADESTVLTTAAMPSTAATSAFVSYSDAELFELWGFNDIPDGPFTGDRTTTAPPTTATTTTASATSDGMTTTTSAAPSPTSVPTSPLTSTSTLAQTTTTSAIPTPTSAQTTTTSAALTTTSAQTTTTSAALTTTSAQTTTTSAAPTPTSTQTTTTSAAPTPTGAQTTTTSAQTTTTSAQTITTGAQTTTTSAALTTTGAQTITTGAQTITTGAQTITTGAQTTTTAAQTTTTSTSSTTTTGAQTITTSASSTPMSDSSSPSTTTNPASSTTSPASSTTSSTATSFVSSTTTSPASTSPASTTSSTSPASTTSSTSPTSTTSSTSPTSTTSSTSLASTTSSTSPASTTSSTSPASTTSSTSLASTTSSTSPTSTTSSTSPTSTTSSTSPASTSPTSSTTMSATTSAP